MEEKIILVKNSEIKKLSFPDSTVKSMMVDTNNKVSEIVTDACYLNQNGGIEFNQCVIKIGDWYDAEISLYGTMSKEWKQLTQKNIDYLMDICEFSYGEKLVIRGFGVQTGQWLEYSFLNPKILVECTKLKP